MRAKTFLGIGFTALIGIAASAACSVSFSIPTSATGFTAYGSCDVDEGYAVAVAADCPGVTCGGTYYALCNGTAWAACDCTIPSGYTIIGSPNFGSAGSGGGDDGGSAGSGDDGGSAGSGGDGGGSSGSGGDGGGSSGSGGDGGGSSGSGGDGGGSSGSSGSSGSGGES